MPYVDLHERPLAKPDLVLGCTECGQDVGIHGPTADLDPATWRCIECRVAAALGPKVGRNLKAVA